MLKADVSEPGKNRSEWTVCRNRVEAGQVRCAECADRIAAHPSEVVRRMLAAEADLPRDILEQLVTDGDVMVQTLAEVSLQALANSEEG